MGLNVASGTLWSLSSLKKWFHKELSKLISYLLRTIHLNYSQPTPFLLSHKHIYSPITIDGLCPLTSVLVNSVFPKDRGLSEESKVLI